MRLIHLSLLLVFVFINSANALVVHGVVVDASTGEPLPAVSIKNHHTGALSYAGPDGAFSIAINQGDSLSFSSIGFETVMMKVSSGSGDQYMRVLLSRKLIAIDTVVIRSLTQYQKDSLARREVYGKALDKKPAKFGLTKGHPLYGGGPKGAITFNAPISSIIQKRTRKYKRLKAFQDRFLNDEKQSYIDSRYTPQLVTELTGLQNDSLQLFMKTFPVAYDFSRSATELELKMWVKHNYRSWISKQPPKP